MNTLIPFRWNVKKAPELGTLLKASFVDDYKFNHSHCYDTQYYVNLRACTAKIIAYSDNARLCFVGRSLDNIYDYLSGLYEHTTRQDSNCCLNISLFGKSLKKIAQAHPQNIHILKAHFTALGLNPMTIISNSQPTCFVDVVYEGGTYTEMYDFLTKWTQELNLSVKSLNKKLRFLGVTSRTKNSPNTWRWQQDSDWTNNLKAQYVKNISVDRFFWSFMADTQAKITPSHQPHKWFGTDLQKPAHDVEHIKALQQAYYLFNLATQRTERQQFLKVLHANSIAMQQNWVRTLALEIKVKSKL